MAKNKGLNLQELKNEFGYIDIDAFKTACSAFELKMRIGYTIKAIGINIQVDKKNKTSLITGNQSSTPLVEKASNSIISSEDTKLADVEQYMNLIRTIYESYETDEERDKHLKEMLGLLPNNPSIITAIKIRLLTELATAVEMSKEYTSSDDKEYCMRLAKQAKEMFQAVSKKGGK